MAAIERIQARHTTQPDMAGGGDWLPRDGDLIEAVPERLVLDGLPVYGDFRWEKGSIWALEAVGTAFISGRYIPPPCR